VFICNELPIIMFLILKGLFAGLVISLLIGPIFFGLIQLAIEKSTKAALIFASGIWVSDIFYIMLVQKGLGYISNGVEFRLWFGIIGAIILAIFGALIYISPLNKQAISTVGIKRGIGYFFKGVVINVFNPFVFILWVSTLSSISNEPISRQWYFAGALLLVVATTDVLKAYYANKIGKLMNEQNLLRVKKASGVLLGVFGVILLVRTLISI
jgi:threonine/homoserine/homoserine lactone efflux protein